MLPKSKHIWKENRNVPSVPEGDTGGFILCTTIPLQSVNFLKTLASSVGGIMGMGANLT